MNATLSNGLEITVTDCGEISVTKRRKIEDLVLPTTEAGFKCQHVLSQ